MQVVVTLALTAVAPFRDPPRLQLGYVLPGGGGGVSQSLALPAVVTKFITAPAQPPPAQLFFNHWRSFPGAPLQAPGKFQFHRVKSLIFSLRL